jgi:lipid A disaccharide synthetase
MEEQGLVSEFLMDDIAVMGAVELFPHIFRLKVFFAFQ